MQRVTPAEPFNPDPDARYLRECSTPGPVYEPDADGVPGGWLLMVLAALLLLALTGCSQAEAQQPQPTAQEQRLARAAARACEGLTPVFDNGSLVCHKEIP
ncbi:hypothetical protein DR66_4274 [Delftia acidovorans]|uniref:hypothetical protein n=1 Tax=Delftia acidovorans TaxID=80866 RepID=UPI000504E406|nr:hypothetical protein [Delftia acidovorans]KFJ13315.1 hypothetical protein DR66_4274 [Delftia acidovorans]QQB47844.1 hypothetical protein I6H54_15670 [Delftia acidovorans]